MVQRTKDLGTSGGMDTCPSLGISDTYKWLHNRVWNVRIRVGYGKGNVRYQAVPGREGLRYPEEGEDEEQGRGEKEEASQEHLEQTGELENGNKK